MLSMAFELGTLWDEYGIIGDVIVSCNLLHMFIKTYLKSFQLFMNAFPCADIHELHAPDFHHQLIKGAFKDHIFSWVNNHVKVEHPTWEANQILDDIDQWYFYFFSMMDCAWSGAKYSISLALSFAGLWHFPEGRGFKLWTGDDSKALIKVWPDILHWTQFDTHDLIQQVYLPEIEGHVPEGMVVALWAFLDFAIFPNVTLMTPLGSSISEMHSITTTPTANSSGMWYSYQWL